MKREIEQQVCATRDDCSFYQEPVKEEPFLIPDWAREYFWTWRYSEYSPETRALRDHEDRHLIFLAQPVREEEIVTVQ